MLPRSGAVKPAKLAEAVTQGVAAQAGAFQKEGFMNRYTAVVTLDVSAPSAENAKRYLRIVLKQIARLNAQVVGSRVHAVIRQVEEA